MKVLTEQLIVGASTTAYIDAIPDFTVYPIALQVNPNGVATTVSTTRDPVNFPSTVVSSGDNWTIVASAITTATDYSITSPISGLKVASGSGGATVNLI